VKQKKRKNLDGDATGTPDRVEFSCVCFVIVTEHQPTVIIYIGET
jgi:hypothetical protein